MSYGHETHIRLANARIDDSLIRDIERTRRMEMVKRALAVLAAIIAMSPFGWIAAKFLMGF